MPVLERPISAYRVFVFDDRGKIVGRADLEDVIDDETVLRVAASIKTDSVRELWDGKRRIRAFDPDANKG
jgi:hypothetical protein